MYWYNQLLKYDFATFIGKTLATCDPGANYLPNWHIDLIAEYLEAARRGEIKRLIINMPPRSLKSVCVSVAWPAWLLGHAPSSRIIASSYAASLSIKHSIDCRTVMLSDWYRRVFPDIALAPDQNEKSKFMTAQRGFRMATSVGGSVTGEGGNFLIVDDPINPKQAMSARWRGQVNQWFDHTFSTRLNDKKHGVIIVVMQRLHPSDLTAHLMEKGGWNQLLLPMVATQKEVHDFGAVYKKREIGDLLHEARDDQSVAEHTKHALGSMAFAAQYQQQPMPDDGGMVRPWWFGRYKETPECTHYIQSWDTAIKAGKQHDASVCLTFGQYEGRSYLLDVALMRCEYPDLKKAVYALQERWNPHAILLEDKASGQQLIQDIKRESHLPVIAIQPKADKVTRFAAISAMIEAGKVVLPEKSPWLADLEEELWLFPHAPHDDQVDALTQYLDWVRKNNSLKARVRAI
jgi:predicted phage terminase large subunit-like protein